MSVPIYSCRFYLALTDQKEFDSLVADLKFNRAWGAWSQLPCPHLPRHPALTPERAAEINKRLDEALKAQKPEEPVAVEPEKR